MLEYKLLTRRVIWTTSSRNRKNCDCYSVLHLAERIRTRMSDVTQDTRWTTLRFILFFREVISRYHKVDLRVINHTNTWILAGVPGLPPTGLLDLKELGFGDLSMRVRVTRNLAAFPLPSTMTKSDRKALELSLGPFFQTLSVTAPFQGSYFSLTPGHPNVVSDSRREELTSANLMFKDMSTDRFLASAGISSHWPIGRGCYVSDDKSLIIWLGGEDHLRISSLAVGTILNTVFDRLKTALDILDSKFPGSAIAKHADFGFLSSNPANIGTGMRASVHAHLPRLCAHGTKKASEIARQYGLSIRGKQGEHSTLEAANDGIVDVSPSSGFCISEAQIVTNLYIGLKKLKAQEDETHVVGKVKLASASAPTPEPLRLQSFPGSPMGTEGQAHLFGRGSLLGATSCGADCSCVNIPVKASKKPVKVDLSEMKPICQCGQSSAFPLCDNSHNLYNNYSEKKVFPYIPKKDETGEMSVCACGHSKTKPICDQTCSNVKP